MGGERWEGARALPGVIYYAAASLDGYIARSDGGLDWLTMDEDYGFHDFMDTVDAVVMGRRTFDFVVGHGSWPYGDRPGRVLSRGGVASPFPQAVVTDESPEEVVASLRSAGHHRIWLVGGGEAAREFLRAGCVDRLALYTVPVLLGEGIPLFPHGFPESHWRLVGSRTFGSGVVETVYDREA